MSHWRLALLLGITVALGPLALDTYLPAFPQIASDLAVPTAGVGLTLSVYIAVFGVSQLVGGPLSDRYGRRAVLLGGLAIFAAGSLLVAGSASLEEMIAWRAVQAVGGGCCAVSVPAIVRDRVRGNEAARLFGLIGLVMFAAPALAPTIGTVLEALAGWRAIFVLLAAYALALGAVLHTALFRLLPPRERARTPVITLATNYLAVFGSPTAMRFVAIQGLAFSALMVFLTHAAFVYLEWGGLSKTAFAALFATNIAGMAAMNLLNRRLLRTIASPVVLRAAMGLQAAAAAMLPVLALLGAPVAAVIVAVFVMVACMGAIAPNNIANALELFPRLGGTAAAALGATQFALAGAISAASTRLADGTLLPVTLALAACSGGAFLLSLGAPRAMARALAAELDPDRHSGTP